MPHVSVIIPTFNGARFLAEAIQSVLNQSFTDWELLIVDDGSCDDTRQVVAQFENDARVQYLFQSQQGAAAARNNGIKHSYGEMVAFLDSDDQWLPEKLERQLSILNSSPHIAAVHTAVIQVQFNDQGQEINREIRRRPELREQTLYEELLYRMVITGSASSVMVRRAALEQVGPFDETLRISDRDMWLRIARQLAIHYLDEPLVTIRKHEGNLSNNRPLMFENHQRYFAKVSREIPPQYRFHLPRVAICIFGLMTLSLLRRGQLRAAGQAAWIVLAHAVSHPRSVVTSLSHIWRQL